MRGRVMAKKFRKSMIKKYGKKDAEQLMSANGKRANVYSRRKKAEKVQNSLD
jgi:hypothetical protein